MKVKLLTDGGYGAPATVGKIYEANNAAGLSGIKINSKLLGVDEPTFNEEGPFKAYYYSPHEFEVIEE
ncbi:hypothetical protein CHOED_039 [Vibrio phage CHOED]|uniref:hypothetical protein n=1 Tax=Vibrio phage CHOED TaxID=1458716 RepID=UPI00042E2E94|nr:hypothetical protein CHOED_039 [Vibrio phage CHOED]AHK11899.1 hypothetical protein CHOED_039 [Vibrio phage CHOED]